MQKSIKNEAGGIMKTIQLIICSIVLLPMLALAQEGSRKYTYEDYEQYKFEQTYPQAGEGGYSKLREEMGEYEFGKSCELETGIQGDAPVVRLPTTTTNGVNESAFWSTYEDSDGHTYQIKIRYISSFEVYEQYLQSGPEWTDERINAFEQFRRDHNNMSVDEFTTYYLIETVQLLGK